MLIVATVSWLLILEQTWFGDINNIIQQPWTMEKLWGKQLVGQKHMVVRLHS